MVPLDQVILYYLLYDERDPFSLQVNKLSSKNLVDVIYQYESTSRLSLYLLTNILIFRLKCTRSVGRGKKFVLQDLLFQIYFSKVNYSCKFFKGSNKIQCFTYTIIIANIQHNECAQTNKIIHTYFPFQIFIEVIVPHAFELLN